MQHSARKYYSQFSTSIEQIESITRGLLLLVGLIVLVTVPRSAAASRGIFQQDLQTVTLEIRYQNPAAGQVVLVWGVNGWQNLPEDARPSGTRLENGNMVTPMVLEGDIFVVRLQLPPWTTVDYGFLTAQDTEGNPVNIWEANGDKDFQTVTAQTDAVVDIQTALTPGETPLAGEISDGQPVNLDIEYTSPNSGEVYLVWGLNGWTLAPEEEQPTGTLVKGNVMHTLMLAEQGIFVTRLKVAPGSVVDFGFLTTEDSQGKAVEVWEANGANDYHVTVTQDTIQKIQSPLATKNNQDLPSILVVGIYIVIGLVVILVVGFIFRREPGYEG